MAGSTCLMDMTGLYSHPSPSRRGRARREFLGLLLDSDGLASALFAGLILCYQALGESVCWDLFEDAGGTWDAILKDSWTFLRRHFHREEGTR